MMTSICHLLLINHYYGGGGGGGVEAPTYWCPFDRPCLLPSLPFWTLLLLICNNTNCTPTVQSTALSVLEYLGINKYDDFFLS